MKYVDISPEARIGNNVQIDSFTRIHDDVEIGDNCVIHSNVTIFPGARIGDGVTLFPGAVIAGVPQDLKFRGEKTYAYIGNGTSIHECATVNRGTASTGKTIVGENCLIMAYCHVAHDCVLHDHIIMSNAVQLAGEVVVDDWAIIGGGSLVHQFTHIGAHVMIQGGTKINKDIPPYIIAAREPVSYCGINSVGLNRRGFTHEQIASIQDTYRVLYMSGLNVTQAVEQILDAVPQTVERDAIIDFIKGSPRGIVRGIN